jgi:hypothetical protein
MDDKELNTKLAAQRNPRVTPEQIDSVIQTHDFVRRGTLTICILSLSNGFNVTGESACVDPANYDQAIGEKIAYDNARNKIWLLEGYALAERLYRGYDTLLNEADEATQGQGLDGDGVK